MPEVLLDGAIVNFSGTPPATVGELRVLVENVLAEQHRLLAGFTVDGADWSDAMAEQPVAGGMRIAAVSLTVAAAIAQLAAAAADAVPPVREQAEALANEVLRVGWGDAQARCLTLVGDLRNVMESGAALAAQRDGDDTLAAAVGALAAGVGRWMDAIHARDAAGVSLHLDGEVLPALDALAVALDTLAAANA